MNFFFYRMKGNRPSSWEVTEITKSESSVSTVKRIFSSITWTDA